ncbi:MAG: o-succinylbenzoate--CoA ligase [Chloroflexota bacterium]
MRDWLAAAAEKSPDSPALFVWRYSAFLPMTYSSLTVTAAYLAEYLASKSVSYGDYVAAIIQPGALYVSFVWAVARLGAVLVPLNARLTPEELNYQVESIGCKVVACDANNEANARNLQTPDREICVIATSVDGVRSSLPVLETLNWMHRLSGEIDLNAVQSIVFTSGTTGKPKGVQITFGNLYHSALASAERLGASPDDRWLCPLPFYHVGGLSIIFRSALYGSSIVLPDTTSTEAIVKGLHDSQATMVSLVPTQLYRMLEAGFDLPPSLRLILLGGAAATPELVARCIAKNLPIALTYGLTECASQVATATPDQVRAKPGTVGKPLDGTTVRIVDAEGYDLPVGEYGEIIVSGATVMKGYLGQPPTNGEFHTGDIGYLDADGDLWIVQRRSDLIVSGGENVYPVEVEAVLRQHPAVEDACVVGLPDAEWGQRVAAMVALRKGQTLSEAALIAFSRERLAGYKQPRKIVFVDELPTTASGKVQRAKVGEQMANA